MKYGRTHHNTSDNKACETYGGHITNLPKYEQK